MRPARTGPGLGGDGAEPRAPGGPDRAGAGAKSGEVAGPRVDTSVTRTSREPLNPRPPCCRPDVMAVAWAPGPAHAGLLPVLLNRQGTPPPTAPTAHGPQNRGLHVLPNRRAGPGLAGRPHLWAGTPGSPAAPLGFPGWWLRRVGGDGPFGSGPAPRSLGPQAQVRACAARAWAGRRDAETPQTLYTRLSGVGG